jgi:putative oxidoreductase
MKSLLKTTLRMNTASATTDIALLLARVGLGGILMAHGWQKLDEQGISGTAEGFDAMGIPLPEAAAYFATYVELVGGALLIAGLLTPLVGLLVVGDMAGAYWYVHRGNGVFAGEGGYELVAVIGLLALTLAAAGAGRLSLDGFIAGGKSREDDVVSPERETVNA